MGPSHTKIIYYDKLVEVLVNVSADEFNKNQRTLAEILRHASQRQLNKSRHRQGMSVVAGMGASGCGKSTELNLLYGTSFVSGDSANHVTLKLESQEVNVEGRSFRVVDCCGFEITPSNYGRFLLLLVMRGMLPDFFLLPCIRMVNIIFEFFSCLINGGLLKVVVFPVKGSTNHLLARLRGRNPTIAEVITFTDPEGQLAEQISTIIRINNWSDSVRLFRPDDSASTAVPVGSVHDAFFATFMPDGQYHPVDYDTHMEQVGQLNPVALLRSTMVNAVSDLLKFGVVGTDGAIQLPEDVEERFMQGA